ncbi:pheromone-processing carboxypeptidase kex1 [Sphaerosporella brunnea]|uniref:Carboxypeptidase n=1 Tax=Sphaerosporella brunnea TaxID=1250544 RepID=A0A5J5ELE1_9PEZI|nr:pheromone-processing carboxypeptidase kex1 [Sphaerosporella brunnea]
MRFSTLTAAVALLIASAEITCAASAAAADYFVRSLPGQPNDGSPVKMHAGHIEVDAENNGHLFFWHFQNKHIAQRQRTVIWLNGGPGCSSMDGAMMEIGPYRLKDDHTLVENPASWHEFANVLFVDQPVGTGFSYVNTDHYLTELNQMSDQFIIFLTKFFEMFPEYEADDIYIAGESYAGQHIPYITDAILKRNEQAGVKTPWSVKGLLIGNGWIDPEPQYLSYTTFAYKHGVLEKDSNKAKAIEMQLSICMQDLARGGANHVDTTSCERVLNDILSRTQHKNDKGENVCYNMYDVRLTDSFPSCGMNWPPDLEKLTPYLRRKDVTEALHINPDKKAGWTECAGAVSSAFRARNSKPSVTLLANILEKVPVLLFSGDQDLICNHIGTEELINNLSWNGGKGFELSPGNWAPREDWMFEGKPAGIYQSARNLTYVLFYNASHMVPYDVPHASRDMLDRFMGVDIADIGGSPKDSKIAGEKGPLIAVGNHPNSTAAKEQEIAKLQAAKWEAYRRSGEVALVLVASAAVIWGVFIWRQRQKRNRLGYKGVRSDVGLEEGREWDEGQLEDLAPRRDRHRSLDEEHYSLGGESSDEEDSATGKGKHKM